MRGAHSGAGGVRKELLRSRPSVSRVHVRDEVLQGVVEAVVVAARGGAEGDLAAVVLRDGVEWATQGRGAGRAAVLEELLAHVARDGRHRLPHGRGGRELHGTVPRPERVVETPRPQRREEVGVVLL